MRRLIVTGLGVLVLAGLVGGTWVFSEYRAFVDQRLAVGPQGLTYVVEPGTSVRRVGRELAEQGVLEEAWLLPWMARLTGAARHIKAGEYRIAPGTRPPELLEMLVAGDVVQHRLTIVEGWTFRQVREAIEAHPVLEHTVQGLSGAEVMARLGKPDTHPEGQFYPETYHFTRGSTDIELLRRAHRTMQRRLDKEWAERGDDLPLDDPYEALILASIVERESALAAERPRIAGVFVRRLRRGMRLQTDPTVIYGMGSDYDGDIRYRDLRRDNPYNTYRHDGLPPTPIAMPSGESLHAVLHPAPGDALYFVSRGDGSHHFSATLEEHNRAVRKYQLER